MSTDDVAVQRALSTDPAVTVVASGWTIARRPNSSTGTGAHQAAHTTFAVVQASPGHVIDEHRQSPVLTAFQEDDAVIKGFVRDSFDRGDEGGDSGWPPREPRR